MPGSTCGPACGLRRNAERWRCRRCCLYLLLNTHISGLTDRSSAGKVANPDAGRPGQGQVGLCPQLIPKGKATEATKANIARFEARRAELERIAAEALAKAQARAEQLCRTDRHPVGEDRQ